MHKIMLVDDEPHVIRALERSLASGPYEVRGFSDVIEALHVAEVTPFDLIVSDYRMPRMDGVAFLQAVKQHQPSVMRIILSGYADLNAVIGAINQAEIYRFVSKPWHDYEIKTAITHALAHRDLLQENQRLANMVRAQQQAIQDIETRYPGISHVEWDEDGCIRL